jgi:hypothetical protein
MTYAERLTLFILLCIRFVQVSVTLNGFMESVGEMGKLQKTEGWDVRGGDHESKILCVTLELCSGDSG